MAAGCRIRASAAAGVSAITALYREAFPAEDLVPLVVELLAATGDVLSLVAERDGVLCGHLAFTRCGIEGGGANVALLGPLAVRRDARGMGVGGGLLLDGLKRLEDAGVAWVDLGAALRAGAVAAAGAMGDLNSGRQ
jgi:putative acetyltransferase